MPDAKTAIEKKNEWIGHACLTIGIILIFSIPDEPSKALIPEWIIMLLGVGFFVMGVQSMRQDFGPLNFGCLLQFVLLMAVLIGLGYFIYY